MTRTLAAALAVLTLAATTLAPSAAHAIDWGKWSGLSEDSRSFGFFSSLEGWFEDLVYIDDDLLAAGRLDLALARGFRSFKDRLRFASEHSYRYDEAPILQGLPTEDEVDVGGSVSGDEVAEEALNGGELIVAPAYFGRRTETPSFSGLGLFAERKAFTISEQATVWDFEGGAQLYLLQNLSISGSYRLMDYDLDISDSLVDARMQGPFVGMTLRF